MGATTATGEQEKRSYGEHRVEPEQWHGEVAGCSRSLGIRGYKPGRVNRGAGGEEEGEEEEEERSQEGRAEKRPGISRNHITSI